MQLGYQFVIWDRLTIDLIFIGPGYGFYQGNFNLEGSLDIDEESEYYQVIKDLVVDKFPVIDELIEDKQATVSGGFDTWTFGLRYLIQIGFHF